MERVSIGETQYDARPEYAEAIRAAFRSAQRTGDGSRLREILNEGLMNGSVIRLKPNSE